jgi:two-component system, sensor histidine kinase and response regulator
MNENQESDSYSILIVDDVAKNIQLVAKFLTKEGYNLYFAQSGEAALKQIEGRVFDLILLDIMMPKMDGFEVCRRIKSNSKTQQVPIIFLTAKTDDDSISKGFDAGGVDYVTKPFNPSELLARVKTHIRLQQREKDLRELNNAKNTLFSIIGHDLKTPFFTIMGLADILLTNYDEYPDSERKELISFINESAKASHILLDNLLSWTRMQTGTIKSEPVCIDIEQIVNENLALLQSQAITKEVELKAIIEGEISVFADLNMLNTILRNLINNAIKFTPRLGSVRIEVSKNETHAIISVVDTGIGIPSEKLERLLSDKKPASTLGTENESGTGLGLVLTKGFVQLNNGTIQVESIAGMGTTFRFTLPLA